MQRRVGARALAVVFSPYPTRYSGLIFNGALSDQPSTPDTASHVSQLTPPADQSKEDQ